MKKQRRSFTRVAALFLLLCMCVSFVACDTQDTQETESTGGEQEKLTYTIQVKTQGGQPLTNVGVYIYTDETMAELVWFEKTDDAGEVSFTDVTCEGYVAKLNGLPEGYQAEEFYSVTGETTEIALASVMGEAEDPDSVTYALGSVMNNFTVTAPDGTEYTLSKLLEEKEAVILNFWYLECGPCKSEFPFLQEAYEQYSDRIEVLAMNPVNNDAAEVAAFREENGYTFPMMLCDESWIRVMELTAYPTTVVIDRYGTIALLHKGSVTDADTFVRIFDFFSAEDYVQTTVTDLESLPEVEKEANGTLESPIEIGAMDSFTVNVPAEEVVYLKIYKITNLYMQISSADAYIIYGGKTYQPSYGRVGIGLVSEDTSVGVLVGIGNSSKEDQTFTVTMSAPYGSYSNPYPLELGTFDASVAAGNNQGVYYRCQASEDGVLTVQCLSATQGIAYDFVLYNLSTYEYRNLDADGFQGTDGIPTISVNVKAGQTVQFSVGTLPDDTGAYPSGSFTFKAFMGEAEEEEPEEEKITYGVTVTDENRTPVAGVTVYLVVDGEIKNVVTNASGLAAMKLPAGDYSATLSVPVGYTARNTEFKLTEAIPTVSVKVDMVEVATYTITVVNESGTPVEGALVDLGGSSGRTDAEGKVSFTMARGSYTSSVSAAGYAFAAVQLPEGALEITVTLVEGAAEGLDYTVNVEDYFGKAVAGVTVTFWQNGSVAGMTVTDAEGKAVAQLPAGEYSVTISGYYTGSGVKLTEEEPVASVTAIKHLSGESSDKQEYTLYNIGEGATYAQLSTTIVNGEDIVDNYFVFLPTRNGTYRFTTTDPNAVISYWSTTTFIFHSVPDSYESNSFTVSVKDDFVENEVGLVVGVTGASDCVIVVTRIGDPEVTIEDYPWYEEWQIGETPSKSYTVTDRGTLTYVDITAATEAYTLVLNEADGYYHLGSKDGPVMMIRLDVNAPYLSMQDMVDNTGIRRYFFDEDGNFLRKENYTDYVLACVENRDSNYGTFPLTEDLKYILKGYGEYVGWYDADSQGYLFGTTEVNEEIAWMFACCYMK